MTYHSPSVRVPCDAPPSLVAPLSTPTFSALSTEPGRRVLHPPRDRPGLRLGYAATFARLDRATWWLGLALGELHAIVALTILVSLLTGVRPARHRPWPPQPRPQWLEPPGLLGLNYGPDSRRGGQSLWLWSCSRVSKELVADQNPVYLTARVRS
jgi:hypothetical protein